MNVDVIRAREDQMNDELTVRQMTGLERRYKDLIRRFVRRMEENIHVTINEKDKGKIVMMTMPLKNS